VVRIIRVRIGTLHLGSLKPKEWRYLTSAEVIDLKKPARSMHSGLDLKKKRKIEVKD
jgi:16S rRNA U516 pseudouridylate synthase RsuA-like enzyme